MTSPSFTPASLAGVPDVTPETYAPVSTERPRSFAAARVTVTVVTPRNAGLRPSRRSSMTGSCPRDRDGEADVLRRLRVRDRRVDPEHLAVGVEERAARVARVDGRVGLEHADERRAGVGVDRAVRAGDDPPGHAQPAFERERVADRDDLVADLSGVGVAELDAREPDAVDLEHGEVGRRVGADDLRRLRVAVGERHLDLVRTLGDVVVGDDVAVVGDHEAGARSTVPRAGPVVRRDRDDRRLRLLDDRGDVGLAADHGRGAADDRRGRRGRVHDRRRLPAVVEREQHTARDERADQATDDRAEEETPTQAARTGAGVGSGGRPRADGRVVGDVAHTTAFARGRGETVTRGVRFHPQR